MALVVVAVVMSQWLLKEEGRETEGGRCWRGTVQGLSTGESLLEDKWRCGGTVCRDP